MALKPRGGRASMKDSARRPNAAPPATARSFFSGTLKRPVYIERIAASGHAPARWPIVMVHGGCHTGICYLATPDGREGWAGLFAAAGHDVFVVDWPGHGRSPTCDDLAVLPTRDI